MKFVPDNYACKRAEWSKHCHDGRDHLQAELHSFAAHSISGRFDVILDTCCSNFETPGLVAELKSHGYYVAMEFVDTPIEIAKKRIKIAASVPGRAHYGRWLLGPESKFWQSPENPFAPPETWDFIADLFADHEEFDAWRRLLPHN